MIVDRVARDGPINIVAMVAKTCCSELLKLDGFDVLRSGLGVEMMRDPADDDDDDDDADDDEEQERKREKRNKEREEQRRHFASTLSPRYLGKTTPSRWSRKCSFLIHL